MVGCIQTHFTHHKQGTLVPNVLSQELVEYYRQVSLGASFPGVDTTLLYPYWEVASKEASSSAGSAGLSRRTTTNADPTRRPTSTSAITPSNRSPDQMHRKSLPVLVDGNSVRRTSSGAGPVSPPVPAAKSPISNGEPSHNPQPHSFCEAVYSFKAEYPGELSLQVSSQGASLGRVSVEGEGEVLVVTFSLIVAPCRDTVVLESCPRRRTDQTGGLENTMER